MGSIAFLKQRELPVLAEPPRAGSPAAYLLAPWMSGFGAAHREVVGLLPIQDVNGLTLEAAARIRDPRAIAGLMLADPFLRATDIAASLASSGLRWVANYPTIQMVDGETSRAFDSAKLGVQREIDMLAELAARGIATIGFAASGEVARRLAAGGAAAIVFHPGLATSEWRERADAALRVERMVDALRPDRDGPVMIYRPAGFGVELDRAAARADGVVFIDDGIGASARA
jgi:predicted TIM-barrel enzyme